MSTAPSFQLDANFRLLPFVVALLGGEQVSRGGKRLPLDQPAALTREAVDAVGDICRQATLQWLCRIGWPRMKFIDANGRAVIGRIWETFTDATTLRFTETSMRCLLHGYNLTRSSPAGSERAQDPAEGESHGNDGTSKANHAERTDDADARTQNPPSAAAPAASFALSSPPPLPPDFTAAGDLLIHHMTFAGLADYLPPTAPAPPYFAGNPLNLLARFELIDTPHDPAAALARLLDDDMRPWLPWLGRHFAQGWLAREQVRWSRGPEGLLAICRRQANVLAAWTNLLVEREHWPLLSQLMTYFAQWSDGEAAACLSRFEAITGRESLARRQELAGAWRESMHAASLIARAHRTVRSLHPIDREPSHQLLMDAYAACEFDRVVQHVDELAQTLLPSFG